MSMSKAFHRFKGALLALACGVCVLLAQPSTALADKVTLNDGTVLEGDIVREGDGFLFIKVKIGSLETEKLVTKDQIRAVERTSDTKKDDSNKSPEKAPDAAAPSGDSTTPAAKGKHVKKPGDPTRVAILNFGQPKNTPNRADDTVGIQCNVAAFRHVLPMLEEDGVEVVVIRIASGGGYTLEMPKFNDLFDYEYKAKFRTVAWIEYSISAACMSPWVLEEIYFMRNGRMGGCTEFHSGGIASKGMDLEEILAYMEKASIRGKKDPKIMRSMQIQEPLSCTIDPVTGAVTWFQDTSGEIIVNRETNVLTFNSEMAVKTKFANGLADTVEELMKAMNIKEYEIVGERATKYIDQNIIDNHKTETEWQDTWRKYWRHIEQAQATQDAKRRGEEVGLARRQLYTLKRLFGVNPNFFYLQGVSNEKEWFGIQEEMLRDLMRP